jgi:hypothetical protein
MDSLCPAVKAVPCQAEMDEIQWKQSETAALWQCRLDISCTAEVRRGVPDFLVSQMKVIRPAYCKPLGKPLMSVGVPHFESWKSSETSC